MHKENFAKNSHTLNWQKSQEAGKSPQSKVFRGCWTVLPFCKHPVYWDVLRQSNKLGNSLIREVPLSLRLFGGIKMMWQNYKLSI